MIVSPLDRLTAFLDDYRAAWARFAPVRNVEGFPPADAFAAWGQAIAEVNGRHAVPGATIIQGTSWSDQAEYAPGSWSVLGTTGDANRAVVMLEHANFAPFREYTLMPQPDGWRIAQVAEYYRHPDGPFLPDAKRAAWQGAARPDAPMRELEEGDLDPALPHLFDLAAELTSSGEAGRIEVRDAGWVDLRSGRIVAADLSYGEHTCHPLERAIAPGRYRCQESFFGSDVAALRMS